MRPLFEQYGVQVTALSKDTPTEARQMRQRDKLTLALWCDPDLKVIERYGLVHHKGFEFFTFYLLGVPIGWPTGFATMALPTTILIDENGIVRWIDQTDDYRMRGTVQRLSAALEHVFGTR